MIRSRLRELLRLITLSARIMRLALISPPLPLFRTLVPVTSLIRVH